MKTIWPFLALTILSASVVAKDAGSSTDRSAIEQTRLRQNAAIVRGDLDWDMSAASEVQL